MAVLGLNIGGVYANNQDGTWQPFRSFESYSNRVADPNTQLLDLRGSADLFGRILEVSIIGFADEIAAAASLLMGQAAEGQPVVLVRGLSWSAEESSAQALVRPASEDLFR